MLTPAPHLDILRPEPGCSHDTRTIIEVEGSFRGAMKPLRVQYQCDACQALGHMIFTGFEGEYPPNNRYTLLTFIERAIRERRNRYGTLDVAEIREKGTADYIKSVEANVRLEVESKVAQLDAWAIEYKARSMVAHSTLALRRRRQREGGTARRLLAHSGGLGIPVTIYALHPLDAPEMVRYVGQTVSPATRFGQHRKSRTPVGQWMAEAGGVIAMSLLEEAEEVEADVRERHWIQHYLSLGLADLNRMHTNKRLTG